MHPILFTFGGIKITCFGVMAASGFMAASFLLLANRKLRGLTADNINDITIYSIISGILGARLFYVVQFWSEFKDNPIQIFRVDQGGLVFYGGLIAAFSTIYFYCKKKNLSFLGVIDLLAPSLALGHAFGRIGCFLNGCCFGRPSDLPWAVEFPVGSFPFSCYPYQKLHPVQLYESCFNFIFAAALVIFLRKSKVHGNTAGLYLMCYGAARFILEFFRGDNSKFFNLLSISQMIGIFVFSAGILMFYISTKAAGKSEIPRSKSHKNQKVDK